MQMLWPFSAKYWLLPVQQEICEWNPVPGSDVVPNDEDTSFLAILTQFFLLRHYYKKKTTNVFMLHFSFVNFKRFLQTQLAVRRFPLVASIVYCTQLWKAIKCIYRIAFTLCYLLSVHKELIKTLIISDEMKRCL